MREEQGVLDLWRTTAARPWEILFGRTLTYVMVFLPTACIAPLVANWFTAYRCAEACSTSARSNAVSHLRLIDRYIVRSHLQFDATDDDAPAVHYLVADTDVGRFCAEKLYIGRAPRCFNPLVTGS